MDGDIINPGDLYGRVLPAQEADLCWDGNLINALVGPDLVVGVSGFGDAVHDALRDLADNLVQEAVWIEIADQAELSFIPTETTDRSIQTNVVRLYRNKRQICAFVGTEDSTFGIAGSGNFVHDALRQLADNLVTKGVWVEVTNRREWHFEKI
jgi:hypothetical protein